MSMTQKKHSILIAYANRRKALFKCLTSFREFNAESEIIVVDMYNERLNLHEFNAIYLTLDVSPTEVFCKAHCLNHAIHKASGEYISIVDCDMIASPNWYSTIAEQLHPTTVIVTPVLMQSPSISRSFLNDQISRQDFMSYSGRLNQYGKSQITLLRQHLLHYPLCEDFEGYGAEDSELNDRLAKSFRFCELTTDTPFYHLFHYHNISQRNYYDRLSLNRKIYTQLKSKLKPRLGIYVASYHASKVLPTHLSKIARFTEMDFDYYITDNSYDPNEKARFLEITKAYDFAIRMQSPTNDHGETLQYMIDHTTNEYIALFDVDAFPLTYWDKWAVEKLEKKYVVGILNHVECREIDYHLHPSFMVFKREFLEQNGLDLRAGNIHERKTKRLPLLDPAGKITCFLRGKNMFEQQFVEALLPTSVEIPFEAPFQWNGHDNLRRGYGVTYNNMIFHFWFGRHLRKFDPIYDDNKCLVVNPETIRKVLIKYTKGNFNVESVDIRDSFSIGIGLEEAIRQMAPGEGIALDLGTGNLISAMVLAEKCKQVFSLEEDEERAKKMSLATPSQIKVFHSPLQFGNYKYRYFGPLDVIVLDGPRGANRSGCLPWLLNLKIDGLLFVDDSQRPEIQSLISSIQSLDFQKIGEGKNGEDRSWCVLRKTRKTEFLVDIVMLSFNRHEYTRMTLESLLKIDCGIPRDQIKFTVIDQASSDESVDEIATFIHLHPELLEDFIVTDKNYGAAGGFGYFLNHSKSRSPFVGKIDNDSIFTPGWLKKLIDALQVHSKLGIVGAQEFASQGKNEGIIIDADGVGYYPARFVGGRFIARREVFENNIPNGNGVWGWTSFQQRSVRKWDIGWCCPPSVIEHVGDWNFKHPYAIKNEKYLEYFKVTGRIR